MPDLTLGTVIVFALVVWAGYELSCFLIRVCRWASAWISSRRETRRAMSAVERVHARRHPARRSDYRSGMRL